MTTPPAPEQETSGPRADEPRADGPRLSGADLRSLGGGLRRSRTDRKVAGVAGGLGDRLDVDPTIIRVALVVLTLFGGAGVVLYAAAWLLVPEEGSDRALIDLEPSVRTIVLAAVAGLSVLALLGHAWGFFDFPWPLAVIGLIVLAVLAGQGKLGGSRPAGATGPPPGWAPVSLEKDAAGPTYAAWAPPEPAYAPPPARRHRRGPRLLLPALALIALGWGTLWLVELSGADLPGSAYAALALAVCGLVLVVGAWLGRTLGVVLLAVVSVVALSVARAADGGVGQTLGARPASAEAVADSYDINAGSLTLDLTEVSDLAALDGRRLSLDADLGRIEVIVPDGVEVTATADVDAGSIDLFGRDTQGPDLSASTTTGSAPGAPRVHIDADLGVGQILMRRG